MKVRTVSSREHKARALALPEVPLSGEPSICDPKSARVMGSGAGVPNDANGVKGKAAGS